MFNINYLRFGPPCQHTNDSLRLLSKINIKTKKKIILKNMFQCECGSIVEREGVDISKLKEL